MSEPACDLAVAVTIVSSLVSMKIIAGIVFIGEIGLAGEIRGIKGVEQRINEAIKMGFSTIIIPKSVTSSFYSKKSVEESSNNSGDKNGKNNSKSNSYNKKNIKNDKYYY